MEIEATVTINAGIIYYTLAAENAKTFLWRPAKRGGGPPHPVYTTTAHEIQP